MIDVCVQDALVVGDTLVCSGEYERVCADVVRITDSIETLPETPYNFDLSTPLPCWWPAVIQPAAAGIARSSVCPRAPPRRD